MPTGVKVLSILMYIGALLLLLLGVILLIAAFATPDLGPDFEMFAAMFRGLFMFGGVICVAIGILNIFVGRGLWKGQKWARIITIIFAALGIANVMWAMGANGIFNTILGLAINGWIGGYLLFNKKVKTAFA